MRDRVEHAVMRMNGGDAVIGQLVVSDLDEHLHSAFIVRPIADQLHAMRQVAVSVRELGLQFQSLEVEERKGNKWLRKRDER